MFFLQVVFKMCNKNFLGFVVGYGFLFLLNCMMIMELLGFDFLNYNVVYVQMGCGKMECNVVFVLVMFVGMIFKLVFDVCIFNSQNFGFVKLLDECIIGLSIMLYKKNLDVFELICVKCNKL